MVSKDNGNKILKDEREKVKEMNENRSIKDVVEDYIKHIESKTIAKYKLIRIVYPDNSYIWMTCDYILRNEFLNNHFHVYYNYTDSDGELTIYIEEDDY